MKNIYFISDAHLSIKEDSLEIEKRRKLLDFLDYIMTDGETRELYLVGDLFDFWFEWYHVIPKYWFPVLYRLRQVVDSGITVSFITGNHDFYTGSYLQEEIGLRCFKGSCEFQVKEKRFFVAHGDGYAKKDWGYRLLKKIIRSPLAIFLYKTLIPADLGIQLARWVSHSSRQLVNIDKSSWAEEYYQFARKKFLQGFDYVILGHIHYPIKKENEPMKKTFVCCGDWMTYFSYARFDGNQLSLEYWQELGPK